MSTRFIRRSNSLRETRYRKQDVEQTISRETFFDGPHTSIGHRSVAWKSLQRPFDYRERSIERTRAKQPSPSRSSCVDDDCRPLTARHGEDHIRERIEVDPAVFTEASRRVDRARVWEQVGSKCVETRRDVLRVDVGDARWGRMTVQVDGGILCTVTYDSLKNSTRRERDEVEIPSRRSNEN